MSRPESSTKSVTIRLRRDTLRRARMLAARRNMSLSDFLAEQLDALVRDDDVYEAAMGQAMALLERGFHLGGRIEILRDELHVR